MTLSENQIATILANPLSKELEQVRKQLHEHVEARSQDIVNLLNALTISTAASLLITPSGREFSLLCLTLRLQFRDRKLDIEKFKRLVDVTVANSPDTDVWAAVLDLFQLIEPPTTPPRSLPPTFVGTPVTVSSSRVENSETLDNVERDLFFEVRNCTFRDVEGFWEKFFNPESWQQDQRHIFDRMIAQRGENAWGFPPIPDEPSVWDWLCRLETEFLAGSANKLQNTKTPYQFKDRRGQIDVFFQAAAAEKPNELFKYKHVLVVGELKRTHDPGRFKADFLQLTRLVRNVFADQPTRRFVHAFSLSASTMELWIFDRSGPYSSGAFDLCREPEKFARALVGYATMDDNALGRDIFRQKQEGNYQVMLYDANSSSSSNNKERAVKLTREMVKQQAIVCRGTTCYETENNEVAKFSWASTKRELEVNHLKLAKVKGVQGVAKVVAYRQITTIAELRKGLRFLKPHPFQSNNTIFRNAAASTGKSTSTSGYKRKSSSKTLNSSSGLKKQRFNSRKSSLAHDLRKPSPDTTVEDLWEDRIFSCLVISPAGRIISQFETIKEMLESIRDAIRAHQSLYTLGGILHRDISSNNIIITNPETTDGFKGMLIDLDLAKVMNGAPKSGARQQTGTMQFIAIEVLHRADHTYRHDLESFFYVLLWMCARVAWTKPNWRGEKTEPENSLLLRWVMGDFGAIADAKLFHMLPDGFSRVLDEFPEAFNVVKPLCWELRRILFPQGKDGMTVLGTPPGPPDILYASIIEAYDKAISGIP
ncbi:hypothetical protein O1611_g6198 [Lasiodiplodia mahajangana]|uniref:Uncharacterized protein n=1 Tax=Lasiodiplodia mahajangana TaxID=1108764 RepID=A0ACC2JJM5_9PEZI|nr:hypothetical protein O1611_g6198 [Lasiodiplodia mahajangana]